MQHSKVRSSLAWGRCHVHVSVTHHIHVPQNKDTSFNQDDMYMYMYVSTIKMCHCISYMLCIYIPFLEVLHDASIDLLEHLQVLSLTKHDVGLSEEEKKQILH